MTGESELMVVLYLHVETFHPHPSLRLTHISSRNIQHMRKESAPTVDPCLHLLFLYYYYFYNVKGFLSFLNIFNILAYIKKWKTC